MNHRPSFDRIAFVLSVALFTFLYGFASSARGWFPNDLLVEAWHQAQVVLPLGTERPPFVTDRVHDRKGVRIEEPERVQPGLTLISSNWPTFDWNPGLKLIDKEGRTVHQWRIDPTQIFPGSFADVPHGMEFNPVHGFHLFHNGDVLVNITGVGTARLDACGDVQWRLPAESHHSIARAADGSFWISAKRTDQQELPDVPEGFSASVYHDRLLHVTEHGDILEELRVFDILEGDEDLLRHLLRYQHTEEGITHLNDVEPLHPSMADEYPQFEPGDLVVSLRNIHLVLVLDPQSGDVKWHTSEPLLMQHDPDFIGNGWIGVFDNNRDRSKRGSRLGGSRVVALHPSMDSTRVLFPNDRSRSLYTSVRGKWQHLDNGNLLLTEANAGRVVEVAPDGQAVWEWVAEPYDQSSVPVVTEGSRYRLSADDVATWPCSPTTSTRRPGEGTP